MKRVDGGWQCQWGRGRSRGFEKEVEMERGRAGSVEKQG